MNILYFHDNVYNHSEVGEVYSQGQFPYSYFVPFIENFGSITVVARGKPLDHNLDVDKLNVSSGANIDFKLLPNINSLAGLFRNYSAVNAEIEKLVSEADGLIIRAVSDIGWIAYKHAKRMNKPIVMEMCACAWDSTWNHGNKFGKPYAPIRYMRDKKITKDSDFVLYVSQDFLQQRYPAKGQTAIASNVRIQTPDPKVLESRLAKIQETSADDITVIGLIGTVSHKLKGIGDALEALARIEKKEPGRFIFRVLGPGNPLQYRDLAHKLGIKHCVFFDGVVQTGPKVLEWLENVDIYIQPSYQEGVPRSTIEAMSMACPSIASNVGGIPELLPEQWLHNPGDHKRLEVLLDKMIGDRALQSEAAKANFERSKNYAAERLMPIRMNFWKNFAQFVQEKMVA